MNEICSICGVTAKPGEVFFRQRRSFRTGTWACCFACRNKSETGYLPLLLGLFVMVVAVIFAGLILAGDLRDKVADEYLRLVLYFVKVFAIMLPMVVLHELGHAGAAWLLGWRVFSIALGWGRTVWSLRLSHVVLEVKSRWLMGGGFVIACPKHLNQVRLRNWLLVPGKLTCFICHNFD